MAAAVGADSAGAEANTGRGWGGLPTFAPNFRVTFRKLGLEELGQLWVWFKRAAPVGSQYSLLSQPRPKIDLSLRAGLPGD